MRRQESARLSLRSFGLISEREWIPVFQVESSPEEVRE